MGDRWVGAGSGCLLMMVVSLLIYLLLAQLILGWPL